MFEVYKSDHGYFLYREGYGMIVLLWPSLTLKLMALGDFYLPTGQFLYKDKNVLYANKTYIGKLDEDKTKLVNQLAENW